MKKIIILSVSLIAALCSCNKQELTPLNPENTGSRQIITAAVNMGTKVAYSEKDPSNKNAGLGSVWKEGDTFLAIQDGAKVITFTLTEGAGTTSAIFTAETEGATDATEWVAVLGGKTSVHNTEVHCGYLGQNGSLSSLDNYVFAKASATGLAPSFDFKSGEKLSFIYRVKLPAGIKQIEYTPCAYWKVTSSGSEKVYLATGDDNGTTHCDDFYSNTTTSVITLDNASADGECIYIAVPAINHNRHLEKTNSDRQFQNMRTGVVMTILNNVSDEATASFGYVFDQDLTEAGGAIGTIDFTAVTLLPRPRPADAVTITGTNVTCAVSSCKQSANSLTTYWAPYEIGASQAGGAGKYYGFGMCVEYNNAKDSFANYYWYRGKADGSTFRYNCIGHKHSAMSGPGENAQFNTIEGSRYDTARIIWGRAWRMPHMIEAYNLFNCGTVTHETVDSQPCGKITTSDSKVMYIPVLGAKRDNTHGYTQLAVIWTADKNQRTYNNAGWNQGISMNINADNSVVLDRWEMKNAIPVLPVLASSVIE